MGCAAWMVNAQSKYQKQKQDFAQALANPNPNFDFKMRLAFNCHYPNWIFPNGLAINPTRLAAREKSRKQKAPDCCHISPLQISRLPLIYEYLLHY